MEAAASVAVVARGVSMTMPSSQSQSSRKEWRVVSDHPVQNSGNEVQQRREPVNLDFLSITLDGVSDHELHIDDVIKQREQLQHLEVNLKARLIARSEVIKMQEQFGSQIEEGINANVKLQEQLHEREKTIQDLQRMVEQKDEELHSVRLDHEAAWAKDDLLREQNKELASFRRERDNSEAKMAQHIKTIHDLQEHIQEKEQQLMDMQEQHRVAQETIIYKDEQIREAQAWIARVQEMDALQSTTSHSLQAELRERTEQYNQLWLGCQRQFAEMERVHLHTLQQLELELSEARERSGTYADESRTTETKDASHVAHSNGTQLEASGGSIAASGNSGGLQNGNAELVSSNTSTGSPSTQSDHIPVQMGPQSLHGVPTYLPPGQLTALHPFVMHQQGLSQHMNSHLLQSHFGQFHSLPPNSSITHWQNQQMTNHEQYPSQNDQNSSRPDADYNHEVSVNGQAFHSDHLDVNNSQGLESQSVVPSPNEEGQVLESIDNSYITNPQSQHSLHQISSQFHTSLSLNHSDHGGEEKNANILSNHGGEVQTSATNQLGSASEDIHPVTFSETKLEGYVATGQKISTLAGKTTETALLDEESLLACVVRTIPPGPGGRIRISSTLPNRLAKMLAPLHWSDYKKKYGKLDEFLGSHSELFVIEGDFIQVQEGAQEIIAAMAAHAKVRAAAVADAATASHSSRLSSVAVTPMAPKKVPSINSNSNGILFNVRSGSKSNNPMDQAHVLLPNGNGMIGSQSKVINHGRPGPNISGKQQGRSSGALPSSRR